LGRVDYCALGLDDFGRVDRFLDRQVDRWLGQLASYRELYGYEGRVIPGLDYVADWLRANQPADFTPGIMHGDVGLPNAMFAHQPPARVVALIDWELSTVGDPALDLGGFVHSFRDEREPGRLPRHGTVRADGYPTRQELARFYAAGTGWDVGRLDYYMILAIFKNACIVEYKVAQAAKGQLPQSVGRFFADLVLRRVGEARRIARIADGLAPE
jgi:aminoglycoside phosphotransferase (APT) family kinase protein